MDKMQRYTLVHPVMLTLVIFHLFVILRADFDKGIKGSALLDP